MKTIFNLAVMLVATVLQSYGQVNKAPQNLKWQANKMGVAFVNGDFDTFTNYTYLPIIKSMGGATRMVEVLTTSTNDMKVKGMSFSNITFDEPSKIVKSGKELQATITQHTQIKLPRGKLVNASTLIAVSTDNGINWTFIDTSNKDIVTLRKVLPNLSLSLTLQP